MFSFRFSFESGTEPEFKGLKYAKPERRGFAGLSASDVVGALHDYNVDSSHPLY